jgi:uncharacterized membrane protein required for colicin V production
MGWPDIAIGCLVLFGAWRGWRRGLIRELTGIVALGAGVTAAFSYPGMWDDAVAAHTHLGSGPAHVVGLLCYAGLAYGIVSATGRVFGRVARLPVIGTANAGLGAIVGIAQASVLLWGALYVALFFPLPPDLRDDLHHSQLVAFLQEPNQHLDETLRSSLPPFVRPYTEEMFAHHRV